MIIAARLSLRESGYELFEPETGVVLDPYQPLNRQRSDESQLLVECLQVFIKHINVSFDRY